jgi:hypothetical protein
MRTPVRLWISRWALPVLAALLLTASSTVSASTGPGSGEEESAPTTAAPATSSPPAIVAASDVVRIQQAVAELGRAKREAAGAIARLGTRSAGVLRPCLSKGPGWQRIRRVRHRPQRALYTAAARRLLADMRSLIDQQQARIAAHQAAFARFVATLDSAGISDPALAAGVAAQARRLASYADMRALEASCDVFNRLARRVREFPTRTAAQVVRVDYRATPLARAIERHVANRLRAIDRRHGISYGDVGTLERAAKAIVALGGEPGYATGFQYALSLR